MYEELCRDLLEGALGWLGALPGGLLAEQEGTLRDVVRRGLRGTTLWRAAKLRIRRAFRVLRLTRALGDQARRLRFSWRLRLWSATDGALAGLRSRLVATEGALSWCDVAAALQTVQQELGEGTATEAEVSETGSQGPPRSNRDPVPPRTEWDLLKGFFRGFGVRVLLLLSAGEPSLAERELSRQARARVTNLELPGRTMRWLAEVMGLSPTQPVPCTCPRP